MKNFTNAFLKEGVMKLIMKTCVNFAGSLLVALVFLAMAGTANICQAAEQQNSDDW